MLDPALPKVWEEGREYPPLNLLSIINNPLGGSSGFHLVSLLICSFYTKELVSGCWFDSDHVHERVDL
jgi:hypothetical protein